MLTFNQTLFPLITQSQNKTNLENRWYGFSPQKQANKTFHSLRDSCNVINLLRISCWGGIYIQHAVCLSVSLVFQFVMQIWYSTMQIFRTPYLALPLTILKMNGTLHQWRLFRGDSRFEESLTSYIKFWHLTDEYLNQNFIWG